MPQGLALPKPGDCDALGDPRHHGRGWQSSCLRQTAPKPAWGTGFFKVRWLLLGPCPSAFGSVEPELHEEEAAPLQQAHSTEAGEQKASGSAEFKMILLKGFEKTEKESRIPVNSMLNAPPPSIQHNLPLSRTAQHPFSLHPTCSGRPSSVPLTRDVIRI